MLLSCGGCHKHGVKTPFPPALVAVAIAAAVATVVLCSGLARIPLIESDEARHAEVAREMFESTTWQGWMLPTLNYAPYRNKPAPYYWLVAAALGMLGVGEGAVRLVPALSGVATVALVAYWAAGRWGPRAGVLAGVVLVTAVEFAALGRFTSPDMTLTLWITLGILSMHRFGERPDASLVPVAVVAALGLLTKGLVAPGLIAVVGIGALALQRRLDRITVRAVAPALLAFTVVVAPWHVAVAIIDPAYLRELYVGQQLRRIIAEGPHMHPQPVWFYVPVLAAGFLPWTPLLPAALVGTLRPARRGTDELLCALWAAAVVTVFTLSKGKLAHYMLPAFPPLALLVARHLARVTVGDASPEEARLTRAGLWAVAVVFAVAPLIAIAIARRAYGGALAGTSLGSLPLVALAAALALFLRRGRLREATFLLAGTAIAMVVFGYLVIAPPLGAIRSDAVLARALAAAMPEHATAPLVAFGVRSFSLSFYLRRPVLLLERPRQLRALLAERPLVLVVTSPRHVPEMMASGPFVPWQVGPRRGLYASEPPAAVAERRLAAPADG